MVPSDALSRLGGGNLAFLDLLGLQVAHGREPRPKG
jgi:hypothetical protein